MKQLALIVDEDLLGDKIFNDNPRRQINNMYEPVKNLLYEQGFEIHTIDYYDNYTIVDYFIFYNWNIDYFCKLGNEGLLHKTILMAAEPESFEIMHSGRKLHKLLKYIPVIMTWNKELINGESIVEWKGIQIKEIGHRKDSYPFERRRFMCAVANNKTSSYQGELYSTRKAFFEYMDKENDKEFDLYGGGWDEIKCWKGRLTEAEKELAYSQHKFSFALENTGGLKGYVSEKIFDCLNGGIVPIYSGSIDVLDYFPQECFVNYEKFSDFSDLVLYCESLDKNAWEKMIDAGQRFLLSEKMWTFSQEAYVERVLYAFERCDERKSLVKKTYKLDRILFLLCNDTLRVLYRVYGKIRNIRNIKFAN